MGSISMSKAGLEIFDIRREEIESSIVHEVLAKLNPPRNVERQLPTMLLYDEKGLQYFEDITYLDEYYLTNAEIGILNRYANDLAHRIPHGAALIEMGSG